MNKNTFQTVTLKKGEMNIYDFGKIRLHAYKTCPVLAIGIKKTCVSDWKEGYIDEHASGNI